MIDTPLVERERQLAAFDAHLRALAGGAGRFVVVDGGPGAGKSRLLGAVRAAAGGCRVLSARASRLERTYAFGVVRQLLEPVVARAADRERLLTGPAAAAASVLGAPGEPPGDYAVLNGLFWLVANVCESGPAVLLIDDLHWADEASLRFLAYLLPRVDGLPLLVAAGSRPESDSGLLDVVLTEAERLPLPPLSPDGVAAVLDGITGRPPDAAFAQACAEATGGVPLLVSEASRALVATGTPPTAANAGRLRELGARALTRRVGLELAGLPEGHVRVAEAVAVLGPHATTANLATLTGAPVLEVKGAIAALERADLVCSGERAYDFVHPLVGAAVHERMDHGRAAEAHARAAECLRAAGAGAEKVAAHLLRVTPVDAATMAGPLREAGADALSRGAPQAAHAYLRHALTALPPGPERVELEIEAGMAALRFDHDLAVGHLSGALAREPELGTRVRLTVLTGLALVYAGRGAQAAELVTGLLDRLPDGLDDLRRRLETIVVAGPSTGSAPPLDPARIERLHALPRTGTVAAASLDGTLAVHDLHTGDPRGLDLARRAVAALAARPVDPADPNDSPEIRGRSLAPSYSVLPFGDLDEGLAGAAAAVEASLAQGSLALLGLYTHIRGGCWLLRGDLAEAENDLRESVRTARLTHSEVTVSQSVGWLAEAVLEQRGPGEAAAVLGHFHEIATAPRSGPPHHLHFAWARVHRARGEFDEARAAAVRAGAGYAAFGGRNPAVVPWRSEAALALCGQGRRDLAADYAREELALARAWGSAPALGRALRVAGTVTGSRALLEESSEVLALSPARLEHARTLVALGDSAAMVARGRELAFRCGAAPLVEEATAKLHTLGARPRPLTQTGAGSLTPSERRVAELAGKGGTNREIAQALFVTPKAVEVHLSNVYRKLGVTTRTELTAALG
ncbi:helix-turn-helix transcriptional regulator [Herbidospora cretacea]|uniref:helix-turn-helix transcriptional regulator n=1 Tax=Herbidospora cretacea TaxID=28444 RepID=UPI0004C3EC9F|nr:LuxR family transcriptional regulator [Herbidospora cretacea]